MFCSHFLLRDKNGKASYRKFLNKFTKSIAIAKKQHFATLLETKKLNPKSTWEIIRSVLPAAKVSLQQPKILLTKNELLDQKVIAYLFNNSFCSNWMRIF